MSSIPPVPPPPPPLLIKEPSNVLKPNYTNTSSPYNLSNVCKWNTLHPSLTEACYKYNICLQEPPYKFNYRHVEPIIQVGPTCGLVALSMLMNGEVSPEEILNISKMEGYSCNGEMFSCKDMVNLSHKVFDLAEMQNIRCNLLNGGLFSDDTVDKLINGAMLMVPYDADCNHSPCLRQGHTAHWALICGVIIIKEPGDSYVSDPDNIYIFTRHGKSRYLSAWRLDNLAKSNRNLWEFSPKKGADGLLYVLPEGGIGGVNGLRNQFLMFEEI